MQGVTSRGKPARLHNAIVCTNERPYYYVSRSFQAWQDIGLSFQNFPEAEGGKNSVQHELEYKFCSPSYSQILMLDSELVNLNLTPQSEDIRIQDHLNGLVGNFCEMCDTILILAPVITFALFRHFDYAKHKS